MLVHAGQAQLVSAQDVLDFVRVVVLDAEFGAFSGCDDLVVVSGPGSGVEAYGNFSTGIDASEKVQLGQGIHGNADSAFHGEAHFLRGNVVADVEYVFRSESRRKLQVDFSRTHGVGAQTFVMHDTQDFGVAVGFGREIHPEAGMIHQSSDFVAAAAQDVFVVDVQRAAVGLEQIEGAGVSEKVHGGGESAVCHEAGWGHRGVSPSRLMSSSSLRKASRIRRTR